MAALDRLVRIGAVAMRQMWHFARRPYRDVGFEKRGLDIECDMNAEVTIQAVRLELDSRNI